MEAGLATTSAINQQPWFFVVLTNEDTMTEISASMSFGRPAGAPPAGAAPAGNVPAAPPAGASAAKAGFGDSPAAILIYMNTDTPSPNPNFDCGLACQSMVVAANALGYGTKIISSPTMALNGENHDALCEKLGVDPALQAVAVLLLGNVDTDIDGATGSSVRSPLMEKVSFIQ